MVTSTAEPPSATTLRGPGKRTVLATRVAALALSLASAGCAAMYSQRPDVEDMTIGELDAWTINPACALRENVALEEVSGGKEPTFLGVMKVDNESFQEALRVSIANSSLGAPPGRAANYSLNARIVSAEEPGGGGLVFDAETMLEVEYTIRERSSGAQVWGETIKTTHAEKLLESSLEGAKREEWATERVAKANIEEFLFRVCKFSKSNLHARR